MNSTLSNHQGRLRQPVVQKLQMPAPTPKMSTTQKHGDNRLKESDKTSKKSSKEPKFVPYEPYKAAVNPIFTQTKEKSVKPLMKVESSCKEKGRQGEKVARVLPLAPQPVVKCEENAGNASNVDILNELQQLKKEKKDLEDQLNMQIKVNSDLKKLLVASVGEDLEARVQFLTEDKVKLAHDVHRYVQRLIEDYEELEQLSIQCDVWRSKFLASSLIVDELANWKAVLYHRYDEALHTLQVLVQEQTKIRRQVHNSYCCLKSIQSNVDPKACQRRCRSSNGSGTGTGVDVVAEIEQLALSLHSTLLGIPFSHCGQNDKLTTSPGEELARKIISGPGLCHLPLDRLALMSMEMGSAPKGIAHRFHPNTRYEHLTMNCCPHCSGEIKLL